MRERQEKKTSPLRVLLVFPAIVIGCLISGMILGAYFGSAGIGAAIGAGLGVGGGACIVIALVVWGKSIDKF